MDIKKSIGDRITSSRKDLGITIKELASRTNKFSAARINNWELGTRSPGPTEAKILSNALGVSPSYLLCLSDSPKGDLHLQSEVLPRYIPIIPFDKNIIDQSYIQQLIKNISHYHDGKDKISLANESRAIAGLNTFATTIPDTSMSPEFKPGETIIADPSKKPKPGQYVIAYIKKLDSIVLRKYREKNSTQDIAIELNALNTDWPAVTLNKHDTIIATIIEHRRQFVIHA